MSLRVYLQFNFLFEGFLVTSPFAVLYGCYRIMSVELSFSSASCIRFIVLSLINALCFTSYNLASTSILQRLSVVQHAALNSLRRVFAIVLTSLYFAISLTPSKIFGVIISVGAFIAYSSMRERRGVNSLSTKRFTGLLPSVIDTKVTRTL